MPINESVEGTITMDTEPLGGVFISFVPFGELAGAAPSSNAITDDAGHFKLAIATDKPGAVIGKHKVTLSRGRAPDPAKGQKEKPSEFKDKRPIPPVYRTSNAQLQVQVTADKHTGYDFSIKSTDK